MTLMHFEMTIILLYLLFYKIVKMQSAYFKNWWLFYKSTH